MNRFLQHTFRGLLWLTASECLCLNLAFSFAILGNNPMFRLLGLLSGLLAHCLLIGSGAKKAAESDIALYRSTKARTNPVQPMMISVCLVIPACLTYILLLANPQSILMMNLFPLLNAPFIRIYQYLTGGIETFAAVGNVRRVLMAVPPLITAVSYLTGYYVKYLPCISELHTRTDRS